MNKFAFFLDRYAFLKYLNFCEDIFVFYFTVNMTEWMYSMSIITSYPQNVADERRPDGKTDIYKYRLVSQTTNILIT